jgi:[acyl-carrier-protein] S-malonyltransferase
MTTIFMFPGQSSRYPGMLQQITAAWSRGKGIVDWACDILGRDLWLCLDAQRPDLYARNRDIQVGVFLTSYLHQQALADAGLTGDLSLGLSLGEYNHLVHIGALDFEDALVLVDFRGAAYDDGPEGMMASVFPFDLEELMPFVEAAREHGFVEVANFNSPSQSVIAGQHSAVEEAIRLIEEADPGVSAVVIEKRIPMHTSLFEPVSKVLHQALEHTKFRSPSKPYIPNVLGRTLKSPSGLEIRRLLERHVFQPVQWHKSIDGLAGNFPAARFVEVGPGAVLYNLLQRRWHANPKFRTDDPDRLPESFERIANELQHVA